MAAATSSLIIAEVSISVYLVQAKKSHGHSTTSTSSSQSNKSETFVPGTTGGGFVVQPPPGTGPLTTDPTNNSAVALTTN